MSKNYERQYRLAICAAFCLAFAYVFVVIYSNKPLFEIKEFHWQQREMLTRPPNVILLYAEDLGWGDVGCYGHPYAETPNIDRLASEGTIFKHFHSTGKTCAPARAGLMTSKYPASMKYYSGDFGFMGLDTITKLLKDAGYATGHVGKWHIGPDDEIEKGVYGIDVVKKIAGCERDEYYKDACVYDAAIDFIKESKDKPFYLNVWGHVAHASIKPPSKLVQRFRDVEVDYEDFGYQMHPKLKQSEKIDKDLDNSMHNYLGGLYSMDYNVGKLMATIDDLGLQENTIIVFSADHGATDINKEKQSTPENMLGYCGGLRGCKHGYYEGGLRVPFIVRWPNKVPAGRIDETTVMSSLDWLPTVCSLAEKCTIEKGKYEGEDFSDVWLGGRSRKRTKHLYWNKGGDRDFAMLTKGGRWKLHFTREKKWELYDLKENIEEDVNVLASHRWIAGMMKISLRGWARRTLHDEFCRSDGCEKVDLDDLFKD